MAREATAVYQTGGPVEVGDRVTFAWSSPFPDSEYHIAYGVVFFVDCAADGPVYVVDFAPARPNGDHFMRLHLTQYHCGWPSEWPDDKQQEWRRAYPDAPTEPPKRERAGAGGA